MNTITAIWNWTVDLLSKGGAKAPQEDGKFKAADGTLYDDGHEFSGEVEVLVPATVAEGVEALGEKVVLHLITKQLTTDAINTAREASKAAVGYKGGGKKAADQKAAAERIAAKLGGDVEEILALIANK